MPVDRAQRSGVTRGLGAVRLRGRIYWIRYYRDGRRYEESSRSAKPKDAVRLLKTRITDIQNGRPVTPDKARLQFEQAMEMVTADYTINERRSLKGITRSIALHLTPFFQGRRLSALTKDDVQKYIVSRRQAQAQNATINRELAILKRAYRLMPSRTN